MAPRVRRERKACEAGMENRDLVAQLGHQACLAFLVKWDIRVDRALKVNMGQRDKKAKMAAKKDSKVKRVTVDRTEGQVHQVLQACHQPHHPYPDHQAHRDHLGHPECLVFR